MIVRLDVEPTGELDLRALTGADPTEAPGVEGLRCTVHIKGDASAPAISRIARNRHAPLAQLLQPVTSGADRYDARVGMTRAGSLASASDPLRRRTRRIDALRCNGGMGKAIQTSTSRQRRNEMTVRIPIMLVAIAGLLGGGMLPVTAA